MTESTTDFAFRIKSETASKVPREWKFYLLRINRTRYKAPIYTKLVGEFSLGEKMNLEMLLERTRKEMKEKGII